MQRKQKAPKKKKKNPTTNYRRRSWFLRNSWGFLPVKSPRFLPTPSTPSLALAKGFRPTRMEKETLSPSPEAVGDPGL